MNWRKRWSDFRERHAEGRPSRRPFCCHNARLHIEGACKELALKTRTHLVLDDHLVAQVMVRAGVKTRQAAIEAALRAYVCAPGYPGLLKLAGSGVIADGYDPKAAYGASVCAVPSAAPTIA
ncbi:type II toxin-antitoxin system VapB family antitoxin [Variovorax robiniae]|uniref:Type II toxin-antitoxin system VapB family antitoxin n=1 Tax=Variovorax robiniae TaxID=1836199 RepID=A0ABU8XDL2_9BURK